ncbi:MAG TPA: hypothetical protein VHG28_23035 [Longimicrobiaceae bacterium]|nr:hypothetical protein [Longimicrobiaceae bacterium]
MRNLFRRLVLAATVAVLAPTAARAQDDGTPLAVTRSYFAALNAGDWPAAAGHMHPEALDQFRNAMGILTRVDSSGEAARQVLGLQSAAELESLAPGQVFARFLETLVRNSPEAAEALRLMIVETTADTPESEGVRRVDYRLRINQEGPPVASSVRLKQHDGAWRLLLTADLDALVRSVGAQGAQTP